MEAALNQPHSITCEEQMPVVCVCRLLLHPFWFMALFPSITLIRVDHNSAQCGANGVRYSDTDGKKRKVQAGT